METKGTAQFNYVNSAKEGNRLMNRLVDVAQPGSVFSEPVKVGEYTLITASTVSTSLAFGYGGGYNQQAVQAAAEQTGEEPSAPESAAEDSPQVGGSGGGGGGFSMGRPVAVISVGPNGVRIDPIVDLTRIGVAVFGTIARIYFAMRRRQHLHRG